ncbi:hypothetical protein [Asanoa sp. NPDC050611]|uniref:hypothetical protein n=1 Tax=Asanoa sp. NPDC050611 TaxID=3157098 RepID=UPI0033DF60F8
MFTRRTGDLPLPFAADSPEGLAARWVRWVASHGPFANPVADTTGARAGGNQPDDVWFLAGTYGGGVERRCTVPAGRPLFFPAFNMWFWPTTEPAPHLHTAWGTLLVDGAEADLKEIGTASFLVAGAFGNGVTRSRKPVPTAVWGLWKQLDALPPGPHTVRFSGGDGHGFTVDATYHLDVR